MTYLDLSFCVLKHNLGLLDCNVDCEWMQESQTEFLQASNDIELFEYQALSLELWMI